LLRKSGLQRVLVFDIDVHHGNGTQEIFYETDEVLYVSLHENPRDFPGTGFIDEIGEGSGVGYNVNIPLPFGSGDQIYLRAVTEIAIPIAHQYKPQFMLMSAGFDTHYADPIGRLSLSAKCCSKVYESLLDLASKTCGGKLVAVLEGGYNLRFVGKMAASAIARMSRTPYLVEDKAPEVSKKTIARGERVLEEVKKVQRDYWNID
jgi:acetoin utilization deacetylase AcuC-like enzyme